MSGSPERAQCGQTAGPRRFPAQTHSLWPFAPLAGKAIAMSGRRAGQRLYEITIPGLALDREFAAVRRRLLAQFPHVVEVFAMSLEGTLLIAYQGEDQIDEWCAALSEAVAVERLASAPRGRARRPRSPLRAGTSSRTRMRAPLGNPR